MFARPREALEHVESIGVYADDFLVFFHRKRRTKWPN